MKSVIKKQTHYSLLLMRDDGAARTFRVHSTLLRAFFIFLLLLIGGGGAGIAGGVHYWKKYRSLWERHVTQEREVSEMRLQLERLVNLECLIAASNGTPLQAKNEEVGVTVSNRQTPPPPDAIMTSPDAQNAQEPTAPSPAGTSASASPEAGGQQVPTPQETETAAGPPASSIEASPLRITGFNARPYGPQRLRISYELSTAQPEDQRTISGSAGYFAIFADGTRLELPLQDFDGTRFAIARMKPMQSTARIPQEYRLADIQQIEVFIELTEGSVYHDAFTFAQ